MEIFDFLNGYPQVETTPEVLLLPIFWGNFSQVLLFEFGELSELASEQLQFFGAGISKLSPAA